MAPQIVAHDLVLARRRRRAFFLLRTTQQVRSLEGPELFREILRAVVGLAAMIAWTGVFLVVTG